MKNVVVIYNSDNWDKEYPISDKKYLNVAEDITEVARREKIEIYHASIKWYKEPFFKKAFIYRDGKWQKEKNIKPNLIWLKMKVTPRTNFALEVINSKVPFLNPFPFERLNDKSLSSKIFYRWSPKTVKISTYQELKQSFDVLKSSRIVIKPLKGSGGKGVQIISNKDLHKLQRKEINFVAQKFIDSSKGIPGLCKGYHDLRLVFLNNKLAYSYIRVPARGKLLANLAQGGKMFLVTKNQIPRNVIKMAKEIVAIISHYNASYYTLDFLLDKEGRPYLLEMNTMPGAFFNKENRNEQLSFFRNLVKTIKERIKIKEKENKINNI